MLLLADIATAPAGGGSVIGSAVGATLAAFALILVLTRLRVPLAAAVLGGAVALDLLFGCGAREVVLRTVAGATRPQTIALVVVVLAMLMLSDLMRRAGQLDEIVRLAAALLRRPAAAMAALPALIGLMPMPGGAQLSAPMVQSAAGGADVPPERMSAVNYWFRHIWEHWWPLYPGVIVATSVTHSDVGPFVLHQLPLGAVMAAAGLWLFRRTHADLHRTGPPAPRGTALRLLAATSSIWVILLVWGGVRGILAATGADDAVAGDSTGLAAAGVRYGPLAAGLGVSIAWTLLRHRTPRRDVLAVVTRWPIYKLAIAVVAVMVFWYAVRSADAPRHIAAELARLNVPPVAVAALLPLIAGLVTGLAVGFVGTSFPIVLAVVAAAEPDAPLWPTIALAYGFGHLGQMLSPLHICQIVSNAYFQARSRAVYRLILVPAALTAAGVVAYVLFLRWTGI